MIPRQARLFILLSAGASIAVTLAAHGQIFQELHAFTGGADGGEPQGSIIEASDGNYYGTTSMGGLYGGGTVFRITPSGEFETIASVGGTNGAGPIGSLLEASDGNFYGVTAYGPDFGGIFQMTPAGVIRNICIFNSGNGSSPNGDLVQGTDGAIYGTTEYGGSGGFGTTYRLVPSGTNWTMETLYSFPFPDSAAGSSPSGGLIQASDGNFYGVTVNGGDDGEGVIYKMTTNGIVTTLTDFTQGYQELVYPVDKLLQASDGNLYGAAGDPVASQGIFRCSLSGMLTEFVGFGATVAGEIPNGGLIQASDGNFYGTTYSGGTTCCPVGVGTVFEMTPDGQLSTLLSFSYQQPPHPGAYPLAGLLQGSDDALYGTTWLAGSQGYGNVFRIILPSSDFTGLEAPGYETNMTGSIIFSNASYDGLFYESNHSVTISNSGYFKAALTSRGSLTSKVFLGGKAYSCSTKFTAAGQANVTNSDGLALQLQLTSDNQQIQGTVSSNGWSATLLASRRFAHSHQFVGNYGLVIPASTNGPYGWGTVNVDLAGNLKWNVTLADGTKISQSGGVDTNGYWPLYASLYRGSGEIIGWMQFAGQDLPGSGLVWIKPAVAGKALAGPVTLRTLAVGTHSQIPPLQGTNVIVFGSLGLTNTFSLGRYEVREIRGSDDQLTLAFPRSSGLFVGSIVSGGRQLSFSGALWSSTNGTGFYADKGLMGIVTIEPQP